MQHPRDGFTIVEVLVALVVLGVGILGLSGASAMITRMIGRGKSDTHAAIAVMRRLEMLRHVAQASTPRCTAPEFVSGGPTVQDGLTLTWSVTPLGSVRRVRVTVTYLTVYGSRSAVVETAVAC